MRYTEFQHWLQQGTTYNAAVQSNALSRCKRVESAEGDLDRHFATDCMATLLERLQYSSADQRQSLAPRHSVPMSQDANILNGTSSLASAIRTYVRFCEAWPPGANRMPTSVPTNPPPQPPTQHVFASVNVPDIVSTWPTWNLPSKGDLLQLARITAPYIRFLHPNIVQAIVEDNECHREEWETRLREQGLDPTLYLWERSSCTFPGVRRYAGSTEIAQHRGRMAVTGGPENALKLDDNHYPKMVWSFIFRGKTFQNQGPSGYSLAHLADHKEYKNRGQEEFDMQGETNLHTALFGLFTSVANTVYMPVGLIRPTDFNVTLRNLIQRQAHHLYGNFCNLLPPHLSVRAQESGAWSLDAFDWSEPVGTTKHVSTFLNYRTQEMERLFSMRPKA